MKQTILCAVLAICSINGIQAQSPNTTLVYYYVNMDEVYQAELQTMHEGFENLKTVLKGENPLSAPFRDSFYTYLDRRIAAESPYRLLPANTLDNTEGKNVLYTKAGYPMASVKRAITHRTSAHYAKVYVSVGARFASVSRLRAVGIAHESKKIKPRIVVKMVLYDDEGKKTGKYKGVASTKEAVTVRSTMLNWWVSAPIGKLNRVSDSENRAVLFDVFQGATTNLLTKMKP